MGKKVLASLGLTGTPATVANFSAVVLLASIAIFHVTSMRTLLEDFRADAKAERRQSREQAEKAHGEFLAALNRQSDMFMSELHRIRSGAQTRNTSTTELKPPRPSSHRPEK